MEEFDFIIVGQGLAGTVLSFELINRGKSVLVIDNHFQHSSSMVAAGMWNPIVFKRLSKSWKADELVPSLDKVYSAFEHFLGKKYLIHLPIDRVFPDQSAANQFDEKSDLPGYQGFISQEMIQAKKNVKAPFGIGRIEGGGYLKIQDLLIDFRAFLKSENRLLEEEFKAESLQIEADFVKFKGKRAKNIVFCTGHELSSTPWFSQLPMQATKGELLSIESDQLHEESILNNGKFLLPLGNGKFKLGATYEWSELNYDLTEAAKKDLLSSLSSMTEVEFKVSNHEAGIRPTVKDRRPLIGAHPEHSRLLLFNGLGTKGVMIAPWLAAHFCDFILEGKELERELNLGRYFK